MWKRSRSKTNNETRKKSNTFKNTDDGFEEWGGYMAAKRSKLLDQFHNGPIEKLSDIFAGVKILVNGLTHPPANELKDLMAAHGGEYHMYQVPSTTHIIASNLPNTKIKHLGAVPVVKPAWIIESIALGKLIDFKRYLLYTNQSSKQPALPFPIVTKPISNGDSSHARATASACVNVATSSGRVAKTASDPKFLEEFYSNSRLHLIATLGAEFKHLVARLREKTVGKFPARDKLRAEKGKLTSAQPPQSVVMHIDMDCFFVSVGLRNHPELKGQPVAITHARSGMMQSNDPNRQASREKEFELYMKNLPEGASSKIVDIKDKIDGLASMSEIASCSYEARRCGIKNGMFMGQAVKLCPDLKTLPYDFEGYKEVSNTLYQTIASYTLDIEAVSCDEMYVDVRPILLETGLTVQEWADHIRTEIVTATGCPCSTGFGSNRLQARLATRKAKPAGHYYLEADDVETYMSEILLEDLPGVGRATLAKLGSLGLKTCGDVQLAPLKLLQSELGAKLGQKIKDQAFGRDSRPLDYHHERKSVSAEVNYGIRFKTLDECYGFLQRLAEEVFNRANDVNTRARCLTLKLLVRAEDAPVETAKYLGHGVCDAVSKSTTSNAILNDAGVIYREVKSLYDKLNIPFAELRGIGIQLSKLEKLIEVNKTMSNFLKQSSCKKIDDASLPAEKINKDRIPVQNSSKAAVDQTDKAGKGVVKNKVKTGSRGRPKARATPTKNNSTIDKFFSKVAKGNNCRQMQNLRAWVDWDVFEQLPDDIQKEIATEYNFDTGKGRGEENSTVSVLETSFTNIAMKKMNAVHDELDTPFRKLSWDEIKSAIKIWIESENEPSEIDVEMLGQHFRRWALERKIEVLKRAYNFLYRVFSRLDCTWHKAYYAAVDVMQTGMVERYGSILYVNTSFECCRPF
ncbi:DNA repair protein REV1 [Cylas formicarius]|uniref:DNA repair protein REV1 n=1 Tax=Cylas formicarius TaxID=197179 RepID=UPI002958DF4C|nr:DNA repair protein REV1 [Cylas formicarius]XP_060534357.1 DNA repair protein REV1 [Cylas formicarius]XP_060534358.1 DNA repair protein REV1 [Cylas formicarius]